MNKKYMDFVPVESKKTRPVKKRPVVVSAQKTDIKEVKSRKITGGRIVKPVEKPVEKSNVSRAERNAFRVPNPPFINQEKVTKRPLSKNAYQAKIAEFKEEPKGPVTIISKPEKDSKTGLIVTIILTIILGATAGTVAFLLLPK